MWDGASDAIAWADAGNWGGVDYPRTNNDKATVPTSLAHSIVTAGAITIGELDMQTGCTADITLGGNMIIDDAGSENGDCTITAGTFDTSGTDFAFTADGDTNVTGTVTGNASAISWGSLTINSGGTYDATSGTTTITSEGASDHGFWVADGGTVTHNSGIILITTPAHTGIRIPSGQSLYNLTYSPASSLRALYLYADITVAGNLSITNGTFTTHTNDYALTVTGTTTVGDGSGAASTARLICNSSTVDLNGTVTTDTDGEWSMPDASGTLTVNANINNTGVMTPNGGTCTLDITATKGSTGTLVFYNLTLNASSSVNEYQTQGVTVQNTFTITSGEYRLNGGYTLTMGTTTSAGSIVNNSGFHPRANTVNPSTIAAASSEYPCVCTGTDWDWDNTASGLLAITDLDYRIAATTGGGGVTITATRCKFPLGATISSGDIVKIAANTASGFKKVEGGGTLQIVRGGGVVILDGIADPVNLSNVALPTELNPAQICCNYIQGVSS